MNSINKKNVSLILTFAMLIALILPLSASAASAGTATVSAGNAANLAGQQVVVPIYINASDLVTGCTMVVSYDTSKLTPVSVVEGPLGTDLLGFKAVTHYTDPVKGGDTVKITVGDVQEIDTSLKNLLANITFTINASVLPGTEIAITPVVETLFDLDVNDFVVTTADGKVTVQSENPVKYNNTGADSGTVPTDGGKYRTGTNVTVLGNTGNLVKANHTFSGWRDNTAGTGTLYKKGDLYTSGTSEINFYPEWTKDQHTITFNSNGGDAVADIKQDYDSQVAKPADPKKTGYTFAGWHTDSGLASAVAWPYTPISDVTFYAKWTINPYTIKFNSNGGDAVADITKNYDTPVDKPTDPKQTGYDFAGWYTDSGLTSVVTWPHTLKSDVTFYAKWTKKQFKVTLNSNGGDAVTPIQQDYNSTVNKPTDPSKPGHTFLGWYTDSTLASAVTWPYTPLVADVTFYAKWSANTYKIDYNAQSGSVTPLTQEKLYGKKYSLDKLGLTEEKMPTPTYTGFTFGGWYTATFGNGDLITDDSTVEVTADTTLYAYWMGTPYTVTFDAQGGLLKTASDKQVKRFGSTYGKDKDGAAQLMPVPEKTGYTFGGWYTATKGTGKLITDTTGVEITADTTLYASWTPTNYKVTFDCNDGTGNKSEQEKQFDSTYGKDKNGAAEPMPVPTRTGYTFNGWFTASSGGAKVTDATAVTTASAHSLYAQWTVNSYKLSYDGNGSTSGTAPAYINVNYDEKTILSDNTGSLALTGSTFAGWNTATNGSGTTYWPGMSYKMGAGDVTLYARWTAVTTYTVTYNGNENTSGTAPAYVNSYISGDTVTALENSGTLAKSGYTFAGWNTQADGKGTDYAAGATFAMGTDNVVLYAKWTANPSGGIIESTPAASDTKQIVDLIKGYSNNIAISMSSSSTIVKSEVFSALKEYPNKTLTIEGSDYKWIVTGKDIINPTAYSSYDLGVKFLWEYKKEITKIPAGILESKLAVQLSINHSGELPGQMYLEFGSAFFGVSQYSGKTLYFYSRNDATGKYEYISAVTVNKDGKITLPFTHASTYLLTEAMILTDIENHWAYDNIMKMVDAGIVNGNGGGLFEPDKSITRAEFAKMIAATFGYKANSAVTQFADVKSTDWYSEYVSAVCQNGIMTGASSTTFAPNDVLSREQMAAVIYRVLQNKNYALPATASKSIFTDESNIEAYAIEAVRALNNSGLMTGTGNNMFAPKTYATKAQAAAILNRVKSTLK